MFLIYQESRSIYTKIRTLWELSLLDIYVLYTHVNYEFKEKLQVTCIKYHLYGELIIYDKSSLMLSRTKVEHNTLLIMIYNCVYMFSYIYNFIRQNIYRDVFQTNLPQDSNPL